MAADERFGERAGVLGRDVQLCRERVHEAAGAGRGVASAHVAEAGDGGGDLFVRTGRR